MRRPAILVLVLINAALASFLAWLWLTPSGALKNSTWLPPAAHKTDYAQMLPALPGNAQVDTSKFVAMLDRPLFMMTRRPPPPPPPPPPPEVPPPVDPLNTARISGVFSGSAGGGIIINLSGKDRRVRLNEAIEGGWTLQSISGSSVTFTGSGQTRVMTLPRAALTTYSGLPLGGAAPPAPPGAQGQASQVPTPGTAATPGSAPPRNTPNPGRAVFGGSR